MRWFCWLVALYSALSPATAYAVSEECLEFFKREGVHPGPQCELRCATLETTMAMFSCPAQCHEYCSDDSSESDRPKSDDERRKRLKEFAQKEFKNENRCDALANIINKAVELVTGLEHPAHAMREDLKFVLIGENLTSRRGQGEYFAGDVKGANGFRRELRDSHNQMQHAMAGIYIGNRYGRVGCGYVMWREQEPQDDLLYEKTCPLGYSLSNENYEDLGGQLRDKIGDASCRH